MSLCFHYQVQSVLGRTKWLLQNLCKMIDFMKWFHVSTAKSFCQLLIFDTGRIKKCLHHFATWNHITVKNWTVMLWVLRLNTEHSTTPFQVCQITKKFQVLFTKTASYIIVHAIIARGYSSLITKLILIT